MNIKTTNYVCSICENRKVKLWRPYMDTAPLICASCAKKRQSPREYQEKVWKKESDGWYTGTPTKKILPLPKWKVNEKGMIPTTMGPAPKGTTAPMTYQLIVDLSDIPTSHSSGKTSMIPACPDENGDFWGYTCVPEEICKWWEMLPTR